MSHVSTVLSDRALIAITGADAENWLQGLVTQTVTGLETGTLRHTALLTPQGRVLADGFVAVGQDGLLLDVDAERRASLIARLALYKLRAQVEITPLEGAVTAGWGGPAPPGA
jgi:folate-binding Fe-S cluster repair protein YgfZ